MRMKWESFTQIYGVVMAFKKYLLCGLIGHSDHLRWIFGIGESGRVHIKRPVGWSWDCHKWRPTDRHEKWLYDNATHVVELVESELETIGLNI